MDNSLVIWLTGLSASGKTTIGKALTDNLKAMGHRVERDRHIKRIGYLSAILEKHEVTVIASFISPYREAKAFVRSQCNNFIEVYISTPLEECEKRDPKGLYKKARKGEISNFTGISDPYEPPENSEIEIDTTEISVD